MDRLLSPHARTLKERLAGATDVTPFLVHAIIDQTCPRYPDPAELAAYRRLRRLIVSGAWLDVAIALVNLRLPRWQVRRLTREEDEWHCTLSLRWTPAVWQNQYVTAKHAVLELAILSAFLEAHRQAKELERPFDNVVRLPSRKH